jgi:hypothetical protein
LSVDIRAERRTPASARLRFITFIVDRPVY